jgi:hypothetical protein
MASVTEWKRRTGGKFYHGDEKREEKALLPPTDNNRCGSVYHLPKQRLYVKADKPLVKILFGSAIFRTPNTGILLSFLKSRALLRNGIMSSVVSEI